MTERSKQITTEVGRQIELYLANLETDWGQYPFGVAASARAARAIPLMLDWSGYFALRSDGVLVSIDYDSSDAPTVIGSTRIRDISIKRGCDRYPALRELLPVRTPESSNCLECKGKGIHPIAAMHNIDNLLCWCGGLGWIPDDWEAMDGS